MKKKKIQTCVASLLASSCLASTPIGSFVVLQSTVSAETIISLSNGTAVKLIFLESDSRGKLFESLATAQQEKLAQQFVEKLLRYQDPETLLAEDTSLRNMIQDFDFENLSQEYAEFFQKNSSLFRENVQLWVKTSEEEKKNQAMMFGLLKEQLLRAAEIMKSAAIPAVQQPKKIVVGQAQNQKKAYPVIKKEQNVAPSVKKPPVRKPVVPLKKVQEKPVPQPERKISVQKKKQDRNAQLAVKKPQILQKPAFSVVKKPQAQPKITPVQPLQFEKETLIKPSVGQRKQILPLLTTGQCLNQHDFLPMQQKAFDLNAVNGRLKIPKNALIQVIQDNENGEQWRKEAEGEELFHQLPSSNDIFQGKTNDCYLCSGIAVMADKNPNFFVNCMKKTPEGNYIVRFYHWEMSRRVADYYQVTSATPECAANCSKLWFRVLEKAFVAHVAKYNFSFGCCAEREEKILSQITSSDYKTYLKLGNSLHAMNVICGMNVYKNQSYSFNRKGLAMKNGRIRLPGNYHPDVVALHERFLNWQKENYVFCCSYPESAKKVANIFRKHSYEILEILPPQKTASGHELRLIKFRNPHGKTIPHYIQDKNGNWVLEKSSLSAKGIFVLDMNQVVSIFENFQMTKF